MRALRAGSSAMIRARSSGSSRAQPAISGRVRKQPRHRPEGPSTTQTLTQGVTIGADTAALRVAPLDCIKATGSANPESGVGQGLIQFERRDAVAVLTLNRPERLNAMPDLGDGEAFAEDDADLDAGGDDRSCHGGLPGGAPGLHQGDR